MNALNEMLPSLKGSNLAIAVAALDSTGARFLSFSNSPLPDRLRQQIKNEILHMTDVDIAITIQA